MANEPSSMFNCYHFHINFEEEHPRTNSEKETRGPKIEKKDFLY